MKRTFLILCCMVATLTGTAQDKKIAIASATAEISRTFYEAKYAVDGKAHTYWITADPNDPNRSFPESVVFLINFEEVTHVDFVRYTPPPTATWPWYDGSWTKVEVSYCPIKEGKSFISLGDFKLDGEDQTFDFRLTEQGIDCSQIKFTIKGTMSNCAGAAEIEAYAVDHERMALFAQYFADAIYSELKPEVKSSEGIEDLALKRLVESLLADGEGYRKFRVGEYEPYMPTGTLQNLLKTSSSYNNYENPTGVYLKAGESCLVAVEGINAKYPVGVTLKNWVINENSSSYPLRNGLNQITARTEGNVFIHYYTDDYEKAPNVKIHFISAPVQGYWDQATMTNEDWVELLKGRTSKDSTILITRSEHAQLAYPVASWLEHCPTNVDSTMTLYQQVQWAERDILGLERYGRQTKNRQLFYASTSGFMAAGSEGSYCHVNSLGAIMVPDAARFDFWGVGHEWGHNNQVTPGFKWPGCGETTNNIYASWGQIHFTGTPHNLRLEDEISGIDEYSNMRGGRMQTYFEEGLRKGVPWQLQDGPDYHGDKSETKTVRGENANGNYIGYVTTTSRNYDHFVKLSPFWQLNLWGTLAGKCPDIIPMVIESIRSTKNYSSSYNTSGKQQINWMKLACDSAKLNLLPFFEKAGMLRPIHAYIEDYSPGWNIIDSAMIAELKDHVKRQGYPAFTEEINYINGHNYPIYRDCLALEVPEEIGEGCKVSGNKVIVQHSAVKNAVAFETYNAQDSLIRITMYGLGSNDEHSYTQVLYPKHKDASQSSSYIVAVGYDGTRIKIFEEGGLKEEFFTLLEQAKEYAERTDTTGRKIGFLIPDSLLSYTSLIATIDSLLECTDARERPYGVWSAMLKEAINTLPDYCSPLIPDRLYSLSASNDTTSYIGNSNDGLIMHAYQAEEKPLSLRWRIVQAATEGTYHIQHFTTGRYLTALQSGTWAETDSCNKADAATFTLELVSPGEYYIQCTNNKSIRLHSENTMVYAKSSTDAGARWHLRLEDEISEDSLLALPEISTDEQPAIYYLIRTDNGEYANNSLSRFYRGRIVSGLYKEPKNHNYWFYFKQGTQEGRYVIYNYKTGKAVTKEEGKLYVNKDGEATEFTIALNAQATALTISDEEGYWLFQTDSSEELIELHAEQHTGWKLQRVHDISDTDNSVTFPTNPTGGTISAQGNNGIITINGLAEGQVVCVYTAIGHAITTTIATDRAMTIYTGLAKGAIAFVIVDDHCVKVLMQ